MISKKSSITKSGSANLADLLRKFILDRNLRQGDRLPSHEELSRRLGVGVHRLREGLAILEQQGLIVTSRKGGTKIKDPSVDVLQDPIGWHLDWMGYTFEDLVRARAVMESAVAEEAARTRTSRDLLVILDAAEKMEKTPYSYPEHEKAEEDFHLGILQATHNSVMLIFGQLIVGQFNRKVEEKLIVTPRNVKETILEHRAVYTAIEKQDPAKAKEEMYHHVLGQLKQKRQKK
jgi:GntR family transcriptional regulator, transcriptional repressor for pyruvate dehydrogenase complex